MPEVWISGRHRHMKDPAPQDHFDFLLSAVYDSTRLDHPAHLADLRRSGLSDETIRLQKITDVPPSMIEGLLGFPTPQVISAYVLPFADPVGRFMDHIRIKVFPTYRNRRGQTVKYLQTRDSGAHLYFPLVTLDRVLHGDEPLWLVEGEKKSLAAAQLGLPAVGFCGIQGWHVAGSRALLQDFEDIPLRGRIVELVPDGDVSCNMAVRRGAEGLALALAARGARPRLVVLPEVAA
jgi:Domain of unknown function (DUF3854)